MGEMKPTGIAGHAAKHSYFDQRYPFTRRFFRRRLAACSGGVSPSEHRKSVDRPKNLPRLMSSNGLQ